MAAACFYILNTGCLRSIKADKSRGALLKFILVQWLALSIIKGIKAHVQGAILLLFTLCRA